MLIEFLIKIIIAFGLYYYLESRFLYAYEINGVCSIPMTIDVKKVIKNRFCKIIFPREFKNYSEFLYGTSRISVIGLLHCIIFYFPVQIAYFTVAIICFNNVQIAYKIFTVAFNTMFLGCAVFLAANLLSILIDCIRKNHNINRRKRK